MDKVDPPTDKEKRKKAVEEKLELLNAKKHSLVQVLKQVSGLLLLLFAVKLDKCMICRWRTNVFFL